MKSLYEFLGIDETASNENIKSAYDFIISQEFDEKKKNQYKIAIDILLDEEKRKKYDKDLLEMRANELLKNVQTSKQTEQQQNKSIAEKNSNEMAIKAKLTDEQMKEIIIKEAQRQLDEKKKIEENTEKIKEVSNTKNAIENKTKIDLKKIEEKEYQKALKKEEKLRKKKIKQAEQEYKDAYAEAYHAELRKRGYNVKAPWTRKRIKRLIISIVSIVIIIFVASKIPFVTNFFKELYETNFIIKTVFDIFIAIWNALRNTFNI